MRTGYVTGVVVALAMGLASLAAADGARHDGAIADAVEAELQDKDLSSGELSIEANDGVVTLKGKVKSVWAKDEAIRRTMDVEGVEAVESELTIAFAENDKALAKEVAKRIRSYSFFTVYDDVTLRIDEGNVTLGGRVTMPYKSDELEKRVSKVLGVQSVANDIEVLPTNIGDDRLRIALTYRIYGNSLFREYAYRTNPPIHILVERGHVTLTGAVRSKVEKFKAESIARSTFGVFSVENQLRVGD